MAKLYRDRHRKKELRPSSEEILVELDRRVNGSAVIVAQNEHRLDQLATIRAHRQIMRERMAPVILEMIKDIEGWRRDDLCLGLYDETMLYKLSESQNDDIEFFRAETLRNHMQLIKIHLNDVFSFYIDAWKIDSVHEKNLEFFELVYLACHRLNLGLDELGKKSPEELANLPAEILEAGFFTGTRYEISMVTAIIEKFKEQFGRNITEEEFRKIYGKIPTLTDALTKTQMNVFLHVEAALKITPAEEQRKKTGHIHDLYGTRNLWLGEDTETGELSLEISRNVLRRKHEKMGMQPVFCAARGKGAQWLHARVTEIVEKHVIPNLDRINESLP